MTSFETLNRCDKLEDLYDLICKLRPRTSRWGGWTFHYPDQADTLSSHDLIQRLNDLYRLSVKNRETALSALKVIRRIHGLDAKGRDLIVPWIMILMTLIKEWLESFRYESNHILHKIEERAQTLLDESLKNHKADKKQNSIADAIQNDGQEIAHPSLSPARSKHALYDCRTPIKRYHFYPNQPEADANDREELGLERIVLTVKGQASELQHMLDDQLLLYPAVSCELVPQTPTFQLSHLASGKICTFDKEALQSQIGNREMEILLNDDETEEIELPLHLELFTILCDYLHQGNADQKLAQLNEPLIIELYEVACQLIIPRLEIQCALEILYRIRDSKWANDSLLKPYLKSDETRLGQLLTIDQRPSSLERPGQLPL